MAKKKTTVGQRVRFRMNVDLTTCEADPRKDRIAAFRHGDPGWTPVSKGMEGTVVFIDDQIYGGSAVVTWNSTMEPSSKSMGGSAILNFEADAQIRLQGGCNFERGLDVWEIMSH